MSTNTQVGRLQQRELTAYQLRKGQKMLKRAYMRLAFAEPEPLGSVARAVIVSLLASSSLDLLDMEKRRLQKNGYRFGDENDAKVSQAGARPD